MPNSLELTGKRFGRLKVRRLYAKGSARNLFRRQWLCDCDCGGTTIVSTSQLRSGQTKSCGCLKRSGRCGRPFTKAVARKAHKDKEQIFEEGEWWYAPRKAVRYIKESQTTLRLWIVACPWLGGEGIETRELQSGYNRTITYYSKKDLDRVKKAKARRKPIPEFPGLVYIEDATKDLGYSVRTLRRRMKANKVGVVEKSAKSKDGRALPRSYVPQWFVDEEKAKKSQDPKPADKITIREAAAILGISEIGVHTLIGRKILQAEPGKILCKGGYARKALLLSRAQVKAHRDTQAARFGPVAERARLAKAVEVLRQILADGEPRLRTEVVKEAVSRGVRYELVNVARRRLKLITERPKFAGPGFWRLATALHRNGQPPPQPDNAAATIPPPKKKGGRRRSEATAAVYRFCYETRKEYSDPVVMRRANAHFKREVVRDVKHVWLFAKRHADRNRLPMD